MLKKIIYSFMLLFLFGCNNTINNIDKQIENNNLAIEKLHFWQNSLSCSLEILDKIQKDELKTPEFIKIIMKSSNDKAVDEAASAQFTKLVNDCIEKKYEN